jgi:hypothetical protein
MSRKLAGLLLSLFAVMLVLPISGCVMPGGNTSGGSGVIIENFEVDFPSVYAGENFKLQMKMRNMGSVNAYNVYPKLYNIQTTLQGSKLDVSCEETCKTGTTLLAPDPERGTEGESRTCIWDCKAPTDIPKGLSVTFNPSVRLYYWYGTSTIKSINIASQDELRSLQSRGVALPSETISTTQGPVNLDIVVNGPIRYWEDESKIRFPININMQNVGGGVSCVTRDITIPIPMGLYAPSFNYVTLTSGCELSSNWDKVVIFFNGGEGNPIRVFNCDIFQDSNTGLVTDLWKGQSRTITCELEMDVPRTTAGILQKNLNFDLSYAYFVDRSVGIEVIGRDMQ